MSFGERIKALRKERGMTQKELGDLCGMADSAIRKYESGKITPKFGTTTKLAAALGVSPLFLSGYSDSVYDGGIADSERERFLIRSYEEHQKKTIKEFSEFVKRVNQLDSSFNMAGYFKYLGDIAVLLDSLNLDGFYKAKEMVEELTARPEYQKK